MLELRLLGCFELTLAETGRANAAPAQPKRAALLAYLALAAPRGFHRREQLVALFWPEADATHARRALNQALHHLRACVGPDLIVTRGPEEVGLDCSRYRCDAAALRDALDHGDLEGALARYGGPLMPGFHVDASNDFEDWLEHERRSLHEAVTAAAMTLARRAENHDDLHVALHWSRRACELAPEDECCAQQLIRVLMRQGNEAAARAEIHRLSERLRRAFDIEPSSQTVALLHRERAVGTGVLSASNGSSLASPIRPKPLSVAEPAPRLRRRGLSRARAAVIVVVCLVAAGAYAAGSSLRGSTSTSSLHRRFTTQPTVLVADFDGTASDSALGDIVTQLLLSGLQESRMVRPVWSGELGEALSRMQQPRGTPVRGTVARELALREGHGAVLDGSVREVGGKLLVSAVLVSPSDGQVLLNRFAEARDPRTLTAAVEAIVRQVRVKIGDSGRAIAAAQPLEKVTTPSLDALRAYTEAIRSKATDPFSTRASTLLEKAVALDTGFAAAYRMLGVMLSFEGQSDRSSEMLLKAVQHGDRLTDTDRELAMAVLYSRGRYYSPDRALASLDALLDQDSMNLKALDNAAWLLYAQRQFERAELLRDRALRVDSTAFGANAGIRFARGRTAEAWRSLDASIRRPGRGEVLTVRATAHFLAGRTDSAECDLDRAIGGAKPSDRQRIGILVAELRATIARASGRFGAARRFEDERSRLARASDDRLAEFRAGFARIEEAIWLRDDRSGALRELDSLRRLAERVQGMDRPVAALASAFADAGRPGTAAALMRDFERTIAPGEWGELTPGRHAAWGRIALADHRPVDAVRELRLADSGRCVTCVLPMLSLAYEKAHMPDSAIAVGERYFATIDLMSGSERGWGVPLTHRRLGALYLARGDSVRAARELAALVALWRNADPILRPTVATACRSLTRLRRQAPAAPGCPPSDGGQSIGRGLP